MAASIITLDKLEDASVWRDQQGYHATRKAVVKGLDNALGNRRLADALAVTGMPQWGNKLDGIPYPYVSVVSSITATPLANTSADVLITYEPIGLGGLTDTLIGDTVRSDVLGGARITIRTALQQVTTNRDETGRMIVLKHTKLRWKEDLPKRTPAGVIIPGEFEHRVGELQPQIGEVQRFIPVTVLTFVRRENRDPRAKSMNFVGHVDPDTIFGDPERSWMCTLMVGDTTDGTQSYTVTYEFTRSVELVGIDGRPTSGWDSVVSVYDHDNNTFFDNPQPAPPNPDPTAIIGIRQLHHAPEAQFEDLNLFIPD